MFRSYIKAVVNTDHSLLQIYAPAAPGLGRIVVNRSLYWILNELTDQVSLATITMIRPAGALNATFGRMLVFSVKFAYMDPGRSSSRARITVLSPGWVEATRTDPGRTNFGSMCHSIICQFAGNPIAGFKALPTGSVNFMAKAARVLLSKYFAVESGRYNITAEVVSTVLFLSSLAPDHRNYTDDCGRLDCQVNRFPGNNK